MYERRVRRIWVPWVDDGVGVLCVCVYICIYVCASPKASYIYLYVYSLSIPTVHRQSLYYKTPNGEWLVHHWWWWCLVCVWWLPVIKVWSVGTYIGSRLSSSLHQSYEVGWSCSTCHHGNWCYKKWEEVSVCVFRESLTVISLPLSPSSLLLCLVPYATSGVLTWRGSKLEIERGLNDVQFSLFFYS